MFNKVARTQVLMPVCQKEELKTKLGKFESLTAVVDSGATVPVMSPNTGASYGIIPSSANGTEYEIASGDTLEDLGEKRMAVLTAEGTLRGYSTRCADVTKSLQAVRALVATDHAVCFGLGACQNPTDRHRRCPHCSARPGSLPARQPLSLLARAAQ